MIRTLFWLVKGVASFFFGWDVQPYGSCEEGRWIFVAGRFLPNTPAGSRKLPALKIGGGSASFFSLLPSRTAGLPVPEGERRSIPPWAAMALISAPGDNLTSKRQRV